MVAAVTWKPFVWTSLNNRWTPFGHNAPLSNPSHHGGDDNDEEQKPQMSLLCFFRRSFHHLLTLSSTPPLWAGKLAALLTNHSIVFISITLPNLTFWLSPFITPILFISLTLLDPRSLPLVHQGSSGIHWGQSYSYKLEEMSTRHWFNNHLLKYSYISLP